jgi:CelD/BcsL family acetyltransferase involved in cellulose biosynthesis
MIEIREFSDMRDEELSSAWESLTAAGLCPNVFMTHPWVATWAEHRESVATPVALVGYSEGTPIGIAPLFRDRRGTLGFPISSNPVLPRGELVTGEPYCQGFGAAILTNLRATRRTLEFRGVPLGSITWSCFVDRERTRGFLRREQTSRIAPYIGIAGTWEEYLSSRPRNVRHEWERKIRRVEAAGDIVVRRRKDEDVESLVREFVEVESRSWKEERGSSIGRRGAASFYVTVARVLAERGWFLPFWLEIDGRIIAFVYGFVFNGAYWAVKTSYDQDYARYAPGVALFHEAIGHAFRSGLSRFDFVGHRSRWTGEWATGWLEHIDVALYPATPSGIATYLVECWARPAIRRLTSAAHRST